MEINSADLKLEEVSAATMGVLLNSAPKPTDPIGSIGAPTAILMNERRSGVFRFGIWCRLSISRAYIDSRE